MTLDSGVLGRLGALPAGYRDVAMAAVVAILSFTPGLADKATVLGWPTVHRPFDLLAAVRQIRALGPDATVLAAEPRPCRGFRDPVWPDPMRTAGARV